MNLQIHHVLSDIRGVTGLAIIDAILGGERDPQVLAKLRDWRVRASEEIVAKSLVGDYRREHLFTLCQSVVAYRQCQQLIAECDQEIHRGLETLPKNGMRFLNPDPFVSRLLAQHHLTNRAFT